MVAVRNTRNVMENKIEFEILSGAFSVCKLNPTEQIPAWLSKSSFSSITKTVDELSIVCEQGLVPTDVEAERDWVGLRIVGTIAFSQTGVISSITSPLAEAKISVFAISTFNTDYLFIKKENQEEAIITLKSNGLVVSET